MRAWHRPGVDDWTGAIVRLRDGRLCRVEAGRRRVLEVHTENDQALNVDRGIVTMIRPPLGYGSKRVLDPLQETAAERIERTGPWWAGLVGLAALLVACGLMVYALSTGGL
jgi:hypothetical protein